MDKTALKEYLEILIDMEKNIFMQNNAISSIQNEIALLKNIPVIKKPVSRDTETTDFPLSSGIVMTVLGFLVLRWALRAISDMGVTFIFLGGFFVLLGGAFTLGGLFTLFMSLVSKISCAMESKRNSEEYMKALAKYQEAVKQNNLLIEQRKIKIAAYNRELAKMQSASRKSAEKLTQFYSSDIIYPKYRSLPHLCSLYEYIASGRADSLEGRDGAYNILEFEIRMDRLITQMDTVISKLNTIAQNQYMLYSAINECTQKTNTLLQETQSFTQSLNERDAKLSLGIEELCKNTAISSYYNERTARELHYMNRMDYLTGRNDKVFFNEPPSL